MLYLRNNKVLGEHFLSYALQRLCKHRFGKPTEEFDGCEVPAVVALVEFPAQLSRQLIDDTVFSRGIPVVLFVPNELQVGTYLSLRVVANISGTHVP